MDARALDAVLAEYGLSASASERLESADNDVFKIHTPEGDRFVLRVHHGFDPLAEARAHAWTEHAWLAHIRASTDLVVPRPLRTRSGEPSGTARIGDRERVFMLFAWIEGEPGDAALDRAAAERMGRAIARLHASSRDVPLAEEACRVHWGERTFFGRDSWLGSGQARRDLEPGPLELVQAASAGVRSALRELGSEPRFYGLIHSDTHPGNMLRLEDGELALLDFNDCGWGHYALDLGVMLHDLLYLRPDEPELGAAVLEGYRAHGPLPVADPAQIPAFVALRALSSLAWIARSPDPAERRRALRERPGVPAILRRLEEFSTG